MMEIAKYIFLSLEFLMCLIIILFFTTIGYMIVGKLELKGFKEILVDFVFSVAGLIAVAVYLYFNL